MHSSMYSSAGDQNPGVPPVVTPFNAVLSMNVCKSIFLYSFFAVSEFRFRRASDIQIVRNCYVYRKQHISCYLHLVSTSKTAIDILLKFFGFFSDFLLNYMPESCVTLTSMFDLTNDTRSATDPDTRVFP